MSELNLLPSHPVTETGEFILKGAALSSRSQFVHANDVSHGVPQDSVFGPIRFILPVGNISGKPPVILILEVR